MKQKQESGNSGRWWLSGCEDGSEWGEGGYALKGWFNFSFFTFPFTFLKHWTPAASSPKLRGL